MYAGVFRVDDNRREMNIHAGRSEDGIHWRIEPKPIEFSGDDPEVTQLVYRYDPRVCWIEDRYYVTWCNGYHGPTIGVGYTTDFVHFTQLENAFLPYNRNGVLFPRKIDGKYAMLSRPSDTGHTPVRRHLLQRKPRHDLLGQAPLGDGTAGRLAVDQDRRWPDTHRDAAKAGCSSTTAS